VAGDLRCIDASQIARLAGTLPPPAFGEKPQLRWIAVEKRRLA
jgi:hypothetical protein